MPGSELSGPNGINDGNARLVSVLNRKIFRLYGDDPNPLSGVPGNGNPESGPNRAARRSEVYALSDSSRAPWGLPPGEREEEEGEDEDEGGVTLKREKFDEVLDGMNRSPMIVREGEGW